MNLRFPCAALCGAMLLAASARAAPPHVHGVAALDVALDGHSLQLSIDSPLDNFVGFEHAPANDKETRAIRAMAQRFSKAQELFAPSPAAGCVVKSVQLGSPVIDAKLLAAPGVAPLPPGASHEEPGHADLDAQIEFRCERPGELRSLEAKILGGVFPRLHGINVQAVTPQRQFGAKLTADSRTIVF